MKRIVTIGPLLLSLFGCGEPQDLDVGDLQSENLGQALSDYAAQWDGYAEAFVFDGDETDRVRLTIDVNGEGTIRLGEEELFAAPTDADDLHPPTFPEEGADAVEPTLRRARSGFEYPLSNVNVEDSRLRFEFNTLHFMEAWCALQSNSERPEWTESFGYSAQTSEEGSTCGYFDTDQNWIEFACHLAAQRIQCDCDADICYAKSRIARVDAAISDNGKTLSGTLLLHGDPGQRITIVLARSDSSNEPDALLEQ